MKPDVMRRTAFDYVVALLAFALTAGAYLDAWTRLQPANSPENFGPWSDVGAVAAWFALTVFFAATVRSRLARGLRWSQALPNGYLISLAGCAGFGGAVIVDFYWQVAFGAGTGLEVLLRPTHLAEIVSGGLIVIGPLRAALLRGDLRAGLPALISAALFVATIAFATQWLSPLVDLWPAAGAAAPAAPSGWWSQHLGAASILLESSLLAGAVLLVRRSLEVRPGSLALVCLLQGALLAILKMRWWLVPAPLAAGLVADLTVLAWRPSRSRPRQAWLLGSVVAMAFAAAYLVLLALNGGVTWSPELSVGVVLLCGAGGWVSARVMYGVLPSTAAWEESWAGERASAVTVPAVKSALEAMHDSRTLGTSPLVDLAGNGDRLQSLLQRAVDDLAGSTDPRDAEAGRLLADYYVKRVGSHELIAARQHLSRPTFYRRLQRGLERVAECLADLEEREGLTTG